MISAFHAFPLLRKCLYFLFNLFILCQNIFFPPILCVTFNLHIKKKNIKTIHEDESLFVIDILRMVLNIGYMWLKGLFSCVFSSVIDY